MSASYPKISVIIPTLNAERVLEKCLKSISIQNYPKNKIEIIIADGGSTDKTIAIAEKHHAKIVENPLKTGEAGKAAGLKASTGDIIALIDSDNILPDSNWFSQMTEPFEDPEIIVSEPIEYTYRKQDPYLTRYFALLGMNDPLCLFTGNYDRRCVLTGKWTNLVFPEENHDRFIKVTLEHLPIPTIGANGTLIRKSVLKNSVSNGYLFDIDVLIKLVNETGSVKAAKVKTGIIHTFVEDSMTKFFRKQLRRINDMSYHLTKSDRNINWENTFFWKIIYFQIQCVLIIPIFYQMIKGMLRKPDPAWLFHPVACYSTWVIYLYGWLKGKISPKESSRKNWSQ